MRAPTPIVKHLAGSRAYGTELPSSDLDFRGIYCDPPRGIITPWSTKRTEIFEDKSEEDTVLTELHKYLSGYVDGSPNILESLWVDEGDITHTSETYEYLRSQRDQLLSRKLRYTFGGYALQQMKRIKGHNKWINNPQEKDAPVRADYFKLIQNFLPDQLFARDFDIKRYNANHLLVPYGGHIYGIVEHLGGSIFNNDGSIKKIEYKDLPEELKKQNPKFIVKLNEEVFKQDHETWKNYWKWRRERNETRSEMEEKYGFDCKHAMHIVRLLRIGEEVLRDGIIRVKRPDAEELLAIRRGAWKYEELLEWAEHQDNELDKLVKTSPLPPKPDIPKAIDVLITAEDMWDQDPKNPIGGM